jgi:hypothetical protein
MNKSPLLLSILAALSGCSRSYHDEGCLLVSDDQMSCPPGKDVKPRQLFLPGQCGDDLEIEDVDSDGTLKTLTFETGETSQACCYTVLVVDSDRNSECVVGRPYHEGGEALRAPIRSARTSPPVAESRRAAAWAASGADEHASVAAFSRLALNLMAHGAPSDLLRDVHRAALDEIGHAETCWSLARRFGGTVVGAGAFPFKEPVAVNRTLAELAAAAVREGCIGETLGAHLVQAGLELAHEPEVATALSVIAKEEAEHAVLSFRIVANGPASAEV